MPFSVGFFPLQNRSLYFVSIATKAPPTTSTQARIISCACIGESFTSSPLSVMNISSPRLIGWRSRRSAWDMEASLQHEADNPGDDSADDVHIDRLQ